MVHAHTLPLLISRVLLLTTTIVATVSTGCVDRDPDWALEAETPIEHVVLAPNDVAERRVRGETYWAVEKGVSIDIKENAFLLKILTADGELQIDYDCVPQERSFVDSSSRVFVGTAGTWRSSSGEQQPPSSAADVRVPALCINGTWTGTIKFRNIGSTRLELDWQVKLHVEGDDGMRSDVVMKLDRIP